ncbi:Calcium/calmodulin-dependent protein kinase type I [Porphyridium purpureum]|uniref:Calcium/calmodulin-dependent protein kinase type I n=1 Tax=Porphyridium purpureum TaxID=35688 RepID=A0A5J4YJN5_PORPP|nr:Calcium/calmodulin-dependent protein kinase type I [Porphyridium purpureum]|eukprot:POR8364..scf246_12
MAMEGGGGGGGGGAAAEASGDANVATYRQYHNLSGYLRKRTRILKSKKKCFFRLNVTTLSCYRDRNASEHSWQISLRKAKVTTDDAQLQINVVTAPRSVVLFAENAQDFKKWSNALIETTLNNIDDFYEMGELIGKGSYGEVREAVDLKTREKRAVKIMDRTTDPKELEFLRREVNVMRTLMHPNIIRTFDIFDTNKKLYVVMEYVQGGDLFEVISEQANTFSEASAVGVVREILEGVKYLHERQIVHRDIKPENILCVSREIPFRIKLTDFGFANYDDVDQMQTFIGTPFYMAPEILTSKGHGMPVDIYAVGIVTYAMLSGRLPFETDDKANAYNKITEGRVTFPDADWRNVSLPAKDFVTECLQWDPTKRPTVQQALQHAWLTKPLSGDAEAKGMKRLDSDLTKLAALTSSKHTSARGADWPGSS